MTDLRRLPAPLIGVWLWQQHGACRGQGTAMFFHPEGERGPRGDQRDNAAKALCATCPVHLACRSHALSVREPYGVWGGLTKHERDLLLTGTSRQAGELRMGAGTPTARQGADPGSRTPGTAA